MEYGQIGAIVGLYVGSVRGTVLGVIDALTPFGIGLALGLILIGIAFLGIVYMTGGMHGFVPGVALLIAVSVGTLWVLIVWPRLVGLSNATAGYGLRAVGVGSIDGIFSRAGEGSGRVLAETVGLSLSPSFGIAESIFGVVAAFFVYVGLVLPGALAILAEIELLLASAIAPMIIPFLALGATRGIGFSALRYQVTAVVLIVVMGLIAKASGDVVVAVLSITVPAPTAVMGTPNTFALIAVALVNILLVIAGTRLAFSITSGAPGTLGGVALGYVSAAATSAAGSAARSVSAAFGGGRGGGSRAAASGNGNGGTVQPRSSGSAFA